MDGLRYNVTDAGRSIVVRNNSKEVLQVWERLENFEPMLPVTWELKQEQLAKDKARAADHSAELELIDNWAKSGIVNSEETGNSFNVGDDTYNLIRTKSGAAEAGGFRVYIDKKTDTLAAYVCWPLVDSMESYNAAMRGLKEVAWQMKN